MVDNSQCKPHCKLIGRSRVHR
ncbi:hypothetical protein DCO17_06585 [Polynucleobacter tropicus]|uniref:Invertebrate defensins family profile domain-containing protein n=1 Tax=Polynucleobacter tropicus TaxID=1743174 RepID=A0A6M9Q0Q0_9BURK|nr:hypothetical protein DCO17_06585 [Polynucleobacter tropicus]